MNNAQIIGLFPVPVLAFQSERNFTEKENNFFKKQFKKAIRNEGNLVTENKYVLNEPEMADIKKEIQSALEVYVNEVIIPENKLDIYATQSWINFTKENQYHQRHSHPNSFLSGVYYIDAHESDDRIYFCKDGYNQIDIVSKEWNMWNSMEWWIPVKTGMLILFPSSLLHKVVPKTGKNTRCSLAFNTFIKGTIGSHENTSSLTI